MRIGVLILPLACDLEIEWWLRLRDEQQQAARRARPVPPVDRTSSGRPKR
jgi:hypothetical protein